MSGSDESKLGTLIGLAICGVILGIGPFQKGHELLKSIVEKDRNNYEFNESNHCESHNNVSFKGNRSCNIRSHNCHGGIDQNSDGWCDVCWSHGYRCHMVYHH